MAKGERFHAVFASQEDVKHALGVLAHDGVGADDIEMRSSAPLAHDLLPVGASVHSRVPWIALVGGLIGGTAFFLMVKLTSEAYPLVTGGQPIVPLPPAGVITFEGIAIGAILCTVATVLIECGLPGLGHEAGPLDHLVAADDRILISVAQGEGASTAWASKAIETARG